MKLKVSVTSAAFALLVLGASLSEAPKLHPAGGLVFVDPYTVPGYKVLDESTVLPNPSTLLASSIDLSSEMPPVGDQGIQNSCVGWAAGYYDKTHAEYLDNYYDPTWDLTLPEHQISPSFIYNQINAGRDAGASMMDAQILLCSQGASMMSDFGYDQSDYFTWPGELAYERGIGYRSLQGYGISMTSDVGINQVRLVLGAHTTCVLGINVFPNFDYIESFDTVYTVRDKYGRSRGGHALCLVGYDDNKITRDGPGAFRFVNSWGTEWGNQGYGWISYYAVKTAKAGLSQGWVYYTEDRDNYEPKALARVKLSHPCRDRISIVFGAGSPSDPLAYYYFRRFWALEGLITDRPFPQNRMVFDLTDGAEYLDQSDLAFVGCLDRKKDRKTGTIDFLSVEYGTRYGFTDQKVPIPDCNIAAYREVVLPFTFGSQGKPFAGAGAASRATYRNGAACLVFNLERPGTVKVAFYDNMGRTVARATAAGQTGPNELSVKLDRPAGVYFYRLESGFTTMAGRLAVVR